MYQETLSRYHTIHQCQAIPKNTVIPWHPQGINWFQDPLAPSCSAVCPPVQVGECSEEVGGSLPQEGALRQNEGARLRPVYHQDSL